MESGDASDKVIWVKLGFIFKSFLKGISDQLSLKRLFSRFAGDWQRYFSHPAIADVFFFIIRDEWESFKDQRGYASSLKRAAKVYHFLLKKKFFLNVWRQLVAMKSE